MRSRRNEDFRELFKNLPKEVQKQAKKAYRQFRVDPSYPGLNFKPVNVKLSVYSVRIGRHYRALGILRTDEVVWFWIGPHAEYDKLIDQL